MKTFLGLLLVMIGYQAAAQNVSISVNGNRNLQVMVDNRVFGIDQQPPSPSRTFTIPHLAPGEHVLQLVRLKDDVINDDPATLAQDQTRTKTATTFRVRPGFDVAILIHANGVIQVKDKQIAGTTSDPRMAIPDGPFATLLEDIRFHWRNTRRITAAQTALSNNNNYFTTGQLMQILGTVTGDANRLELARIAYPRVTDPANFLQVYPLLDDPSSREALSTYLQDQTGARAIYSYSESFRQPMSQDHFEASMRSFRHLDAGLKANAVTSLVRNETNYFSVAQVRRLLEEVAFESTRLQLLKDVFTHLTDPENYPLLYSLLATDAARIELINYVKTAVKNGGLVNHNLNKPAMDETGYQKIFTTVLNTTTGNQRNTYLAEVFSNPGHYFSARQVTGLISLAEGEINRLGLGKTAYRSVTDPEEFLPQMAPLLATEVTRNELSIYVYSYRSPL